MPQRKPYVARISKPFTPKELRLDAVGLKPTAARLINMLDTSSPAFPKIAALLHQMNQAGVEIDQDAIAIAIKLGEHHERAAQETAPPPLFVADDVVTTSIVYYVRRGTLIKIGTTRKPKDRFLNLCPDEILAFEPGGRGLEARRHQQFDHLRQGASEYFRIEGDLLAHIEQVRGDHGEPDPSWRTTDTLSGSSLRTSAARPLPGTSEMCNASQAAKRLGIKRNTVQQWVSRGKVAMVARNERGHPLYFLDHFRDLMEKSRASGRL